jgi:hypothetical protein
MSYSGIGITYRPDKLPDGGKPGDVLLLGPDGSPVWSSDSPGGGGGINLKSVLAAGNSAGNLGMQEVSRISGVFGGGGGHVSRIDLLPSSADGGAFNMLGGGQIYLSGAVGLDGGYVDLRGGTGDSGNSAGVLTLGGGGGVLGGPGGFQLVAGGANGASAGGTGTLSAGSTSDGNQGSQIVLTGGEFGGCGGGGTIQLRGGNSSNGTQGAFIQVNGASVLSGTTGHITIAAGNRPSAGPVGGSLGFSGATTTLGGGVLFRSGHSQPSGGAEGGLIQMVGGDTNGTGGEVGIYSGLAKPGTNANGGNITLTPGPGAGTGRRGLLIVPNLPLAVPVSPVAGAVWRTPQGFLTMHPHFCVNWPITFKSVDYTFTIDDGGKMFAHSGDATARTWTIPSNASVALAPGTAILLVNHNGAGVITIAITTDVLLLAGVGVKTTVAIAPSGEATLVKIDSTKWLVRGTGLTGLP